MYQSICMLIHSTGIVFDCTTAKMVLASVQTTISYVQICIYTYAYTDGTTIERNINKYTYVILYVNKYVYIYTYACSYERVHR